MFIVTQGIMLWSWLSDIVVIAKENKVTFPQCLIDLCLIDCTSQSRHHIFTTVLANRIKQIITNYIQLDQMGFIPQKEHDR